MVFVPRLHIPLITDTTRLMTFHFLSFDCNFYAQGPFVSSQTDYGNVLRRSKQDFWILKIERSVIIFRVCEI